MNSFRIINVIIIVLVCFSVVSCNRSTDISVSDSSLYDKISKTKTIKVGYISYPPSFIAESEGEYSGIFYDVMTEVAKRLNWKVEFATPVTWDGMIQDIKHKKVDLIITGIWPTAERGKHADFLNPLFYSVVKAYTYIDNDIEYTQKIMNNKDVKISVVDGEMTQIIASLDFPNSEQVTVSQLSGITQALLDVKNKKADIVFVEPVIAKQFLEKNPNSLKEIPISALRVFPNSMMIPLGEEKLKAVLNTAINELINNGFVDKVISKYEKFPNSFKRVAVPYSK